MKKVANLPLLPITENFSRRFKSRTIDCYDAEVFMDETTSFILRSTAEIKYNEQEYKYKTGKKGKSNKDLKNFCSQALRLIKINEIEHIVEFGGNDLTLAYELQDKVKSYSRKGRVLKH